MEFEVKEAVSLEDGKYEGIVSRIEYREEPYAYTDIFIKEKDSEMELKYGCPSRISTKSKLGKLIGQFHELQKGAKIDPEKVLLNKEVTFMVMQEKTNDGVFSRVVDESVKPKVTEEKV